MTVVNSKEFVTNQKRYFDLAKRERIMIRRGKSMFHLTYAPAEIQYLEDEKIENEYLINLAESRLDEETIPLENIFKKYSFK